MTKPIVTVGDLKKIIHESLNVDDKQPLVEAYVTMPKEFELPTQLLSEKTKRAHEELYKGYIEKLNRISAEMDTIDRASAGKTPAYAALKAAEITNRNAVYLHELYFANISDTQSEISYDSLAYIKLTRDFGTFDDWQWDFMACAMGANADGWAVTAYDTFLKRYVNFIVEHNYEYIPVGCYPIIVVDMHEHAYFRDYLNDKEKYLTGMMRELNWEVIDRRAARAEAIANVLETEQRHWT